MLENFNRYLPSNPIIEKDDFIIYGNNDITNIKENYIKGESV